MKIKLLCLALTLSLSSAFAVELSPPNGQTGTEFGYALSANGNTLAVATGLQSQTGTIYVYQPTTKNWNTATLVAQLTASDGAQFSSVAVYGSVIVAGAAEDSVNGNVHQGAVYGFVAGETGWTSGNETFKLTASDGAPGDYLGVSIAFNNKTIIVGADGVSQSRGAAYVFSEPLSGWQSATETAKLTASNAKAGDTFGISVTVNGVYAAVGSVYANRNGEGSNGAVYVYKESVGGWRDNTENAELLDGEGPRCEEMGASVAILSGTLAVGTQCANRVLIYQEPEGGWQSTNVPNAVLTPSKTQPAKGFGTSLALNNKFLVIGDPNAGTGQLRRGAVFVYVEPEGGWVDETETQEITEGGAGMGVGNSVAAFSTGALFVGAPYTSQGEEIESGAAFIQSWPAK
jgi:hypothetical protein